jgi:transposase
MPDEFFALIVHHLTPEQPVGPRGGRPRVRHKVAVRVIWFVLATGNRWEDVPRELGCELPQVWWSPSLRCKLRARSLPMPRPRSTYTAEFKLSAVKMITEQKLSVAEAARRLDVGENLLREWRKAFLARGDGAFPGHGTPAPAGDELRRLRAENARLRAERDLLKKAAAYFANPPS